MLLRLLILVLAVAGLIDALYFTFAYYGRVRRARWVPEVLCAREGSTCVTVVQTPYARVFGAPNSLLGVVYYLLVIARALAGRPEWEHADFFVILVSATTVVLGFYLIYALRRKLHTNCPMCYTAHGINLALLALLAWMVISSG